MDAAPAAVFLVTSRERLRVAGEHVLAITPLAVPAPLDPSPERILAAEAVRRMVDRARAARAGFLPSPGDAEALAEIARRVEGVPLALELCAARLGMLEPARLLGRLSHRLDVLAGDLRGAPRRQATLRGAIDWSWDLLDEAERSVLAQCSVFRGGFNLDAAEAIIVPPGGEGRVLDLLSALHDKSPLAIDDTEGPARRYRLYESVRAYAAENAGAGMAEGVSDRHARWFAESGLRWAAEARGARFERGSWRSSARWTTSSRRALASRPPAT